MRRIQCAALFAGIALLGGVSVYAEQATVTLDGKTTTVNYASAAMKGRKIFGVVVPLNQVWKIGESSSPALHVEADIVFKGVMVPKGDYSLYVLPGADRWVLIINKQTSGRPYDPKLDVGRVNMVVTKAPTPVEVSRITLTKSAALAAKLEIAWENSVAQAQFHLDRVAGNSEW